MRYPEIVYGSVTGAHELKIFSKERFGEIKSQRHPSVKQLVNEVPQCDRKKSLLYKQNAQSLLASKPVLTHVFKSVTQTQ